MAKFSPSLFRIVNNLGKIVVRIFRIVTKMVPYIVSYGPIRSQMVLYGPLWSHIFPYGSVWSFIVKYCPLWSHMVLYGLIWSSMVLYHPLWSRMVLFGSGWYHMVPYSLYSPFDFCAPMMFYEVLEGIKVSPILKALRSCLTLSWSSSPLVERVSR